MSNLVIQKKAVDVNAVIRFLERVLAEDRPIQDVHALLGNDFIFLSRDYERTQVEILLSFLRRAA
jgi:hypothetical protein